MSSIVSSTSSADYHFTSMKDSRPAWYEASANEAASDSSSSISTDQHPMSLDATNTIRWTPWQPIVAADGEWTGYWINIRV